MSSYCITFPLIVEKYQEDKLDKCFEIGRKMYKSMIETRMYRSLKIKVKELYYLKDEDLPQWWHDKIRD